jgi:hypothetical protein
MEELDTINQRLADTYGLFENGWANWRIVWGDDQREIRFGTFPKFSEAGIYLGEFTGWQEVPKYSQWIKHAWVLERLFPVPALNTKELTSKLSYEPVWVFRDGKDNPLPYNWDVCLIVINSILNESARRMGVKYKDPELIEGEAAEIELERIKKLEIELFGNDTEVSDALFYKQGIVVPNNFESNQEKENGIRATEQPPTID